MECCGLLVSDVLETTNTAFGHGTDFLLLFLSQTPPARTNQTKFLPSTPPVVSTTSNSKKFTEHSGARVTLTGTEVVIFVMIWMIGFQEIKKMTRFVILMVVREAVPLLDLTA